MTALPAPSTPQKRLPKDVETVAPLTPQQRGILFHSLQSREADPYFKHFVFVLRGPLDRSAFERAWAAVAARYPALRTDYRWEETESPLQLILGSWPVQVRFQDWRELGAAQQVTQLEGLLEAQRAAGFDFRNGADLLLSVIRVQEGSLWLVWSNHHIALDGWSVGLVLRDVLESYYALCAGAEQPTRRAPSFLSYVDWLSRKDKPAAERYWQQALGAVQGLTALPYRAEQSAKGNADHELRLSVADTLAVREFASRCGVTTNTLVQAAWALLLARHADAAQVVFGVTTSGRDPLFEGSDSIVGMLVHVLPLAVELPSEQRVRDWLAAVQLANVNGREQAVLSLSEIQVAVGLRDAPLFESIVTFENYPIDDVLRERGAGVALTVERPGETLPFCRDGHVTGRNNYPLSLLAHVGRELVLNIAYQRQWYSSARVSELAAQLRALLAALMQNPDERLNRLVLPVARTLAAEAPSPFAPGDVLSTFRAHVAASPSTCAVSDPKHSYTHAELGALSDQLAQQLASWGVRADDRVALCLERSAGFVLALLGVLAAGAAYVPLDPSQPRERLLELIADSGAKVVVCDADGPQLDGAGARLLPLDPRALAAFPARPLGLALHPEQAAYVIYTSGSTGRPKGVVVSHGALHNYVQGMLQRLCFPPEAASMAMVSTVAADLGHTVLFGALCSGRTLHLVGPAEGFDPDRFADTMRRQRIAVLKIVPSHLKGLLNAERPRDVLPSHALVLGGEASDWELIERLRQLAPELQIFNHYGPTETTVGVLTYAVEQRSAEHRTVPVGRPLPNSRAYVLDRDFHPLPPGVVGELYIGGKGLARGYLARPDLTAERFVPDPFVSGARMYRTGDRVLQSTTGALEFLGRADDQIKLRGHRIEPAEIAQRLKQQPGVAETLVLVRELDTGKQLVAYATLLPGAAPEEAALLAALGQVLPDYMVPARIVLLERWPLNANGKIERKALPAPSRENAALELEGPRGPVETTLAQIWAEVLKLPTVGRKDNFFELGGDSILSLRVIARLRKAGLKLSLEQLLARPTIEALAGLLGGAAEPQVGTAPATPPPPAASKTFPRASRAGDLGLSHAQRRLWFLWRLEPRSGAYNLPAAVRLRGALDAAVLQQTFTALVRRHESLRTTFREREDGSALQVIAEPIAAALGYEDLRGFAESERESEARRRAEAEAAAPFDLEAGPLLRVKLLCLGEQEHVLLVTMHHIVSDGWSMKSVIDEFAALYSAYRRGEAAALAPLPIQYADYALWQQRWLADGEGQRQLDYWKSKLGGSDPVLELPSDRPRPAVQSHRGASVRFELSAELSGRLRALARAEQATPFMLLLAAFQVLLHRYSGQSEIRVGVPNANRTREELESIVGFFVNTQVLSATLSGDERFVDALQRVKQAALEAQDHQDLPFEQLVEELNPQRSLSHNPLFQVMYNHDQFERGGGAKISGLHVEEFAKSGASTQFDLSLDTSDSGDGISCQLTYGTDLFDRETVERMAGHYQQLLRGVVAQSEQRIGLLPLLRAEERAELLALSAPLIASQRAAESYVKLFERRARASGGRTALRSRSEAWTYRELDGAGNRVGHALVKAGVKPDEVVAVLAERGLWFAGMVLGTLKAGAGYLPLDPRYPVQRLAEVLRASGARAVLATRAQSAAAGAALEGLERGVRLLIAEELGAESEQALEIETSGSHLSYVIYTSGSTGQPKGVMVAQAGMLNNQLSKVPLLELGEGDVIAQTAPQSFDISVWQLLLGPLCGAVVEVVEDEVAQEPVALFERVKASGVTVLETVPSLLRSALEQELPAELPLRWLLVTGEALPADLVESWFARYPKIPLVNAYGPAECSDDVTLEVLRAAPQGGAISLGRAVEQMSVYVLDEQQQLVPRGVTGELCVAGVGVGRGYVGEAGQTAERFVPNAYGENGSRLYRTGDLARYRQDGTLEYQGRLDQQVKLRGLRIELGEIEARLLLQKEVADAAVQVRRTSNGDARLVGYVVRSTEAQVEAELWPHLQEQLGRALPDYMVPRAWVSLPSLPRNANGKLDRNALPEPEWTARHYVAPETELEQTLASIWREVLKVEQAGLTDDFFELGGHSLLATRVASRIRRALGIELPLRVLFEATQLGELAAQLEQRRQAPTPAQHLELKRQERSGPQPLSAAQSRLWFLWRLEPQSSAYNLPGAVRLRGVLDVPALERAFADLVQRHESLRTTFRERADGSAEQVIAEPATVALTSEDLRGFPDVNREAEARRRAEAEAAAPFALETGPLLRVRLLCLGEQEQVLLVTLHHIVSDGWSMTVLIEELAALYAAHRKNVVPELPPLPLQYADYALWQQRWLAAGEGPRQLEYWKSKLGGADPVLELPSDRPRPAVQSYRGATLGFALGKELSEQLLEFARARQATPFMVLLAAFQVLLHRYSGQSEIRVGVPNAGRNRVELERLIGFFVNTQVLSATLNGHERFVDALQRAKQAALEAQDYQDLPFEQLVEELNPQRSLSHNPLFQVMFNHERFARPQLERLGELRVEAFDKAKAVTQFDLTLDTSESKHGISCQLTYGTELFDRETVERMAGHYQQLLRGVVAQPEQRIGLLPLLRTEEQVELLALSAPLIASQRAAESYVKLFERRARANAARTALRSRSEAWTYAELDGAGNRVGHALVKAGVKPDEVVAVLAERGLWFAGMVLGTLKAGGGYLPLDPRYPVQRLAEVLRASGARAVLATRAQSTAAGAALEGLERGVRLLVAEELGSESEQALGIETSGSHLSYVIYTSGSTGQPKGVMVEQAGMLNNQLSKVPLLELGEGDVIAQTAPQSFDISVWQLLLGPLCGAVVEVVEDEVAREPVALFERVKASGVTVLETVPSLLRSALEQELPAQLPLRWLLVTGEALPADLVESWFERYPKIPLVNAYGPAECSDDVTLEVLRAAPQGGAISLGRAVEQMSVYVLDEQQQLVPLGVTGELCVAGVGVGRGYVGEAGQTAERFVPNAYGTSGSRLYRTGDLARYRQDGTLEYQGRVDQQVKLRGLRIELGEIEARLLLQREVADAAVQVRRTSHGDARLVGYVVRSTEAQVEAELWPRLQEQLGRALPDYMVPRAWVSLPSLPRNANGKLDRNALPEPEWTARHYVAPETELEQTLASIWREVLKVEQVGLMDDFFELGGHSLLATRVASRIRRALGIELPLRVLFEATQLGELAAQLEQRRQAPTPAQRPELELKRQERSGPQPLSAAQSRLWFLWRLEPQSSAYNLPGAVRLRGVLDVPALERAFADLVQRHESLRTTFRERADGSAEQVIAEATQASLQREDLRSIAETDREAEARRRAETETETPFDLTSGPLCRCKLLALGEQDHVLLVTLHHIVADDWSMAVLIEELATLYAAHREDAVPGLPPLPLQYADYALWQQRWLAAGEGQRQLDYWKTQLNGAPPVLELPTDRPRPAAQSYAGANYSVELPGPLVQRLRALAQAQDATLFMLMLAAFDVLLYRQTGQTDLWVGVPIANRSRLETERLIGFFINTQVLRSQVDGRQTFASLLAHVKEVALQAREHQDLPFERLVEELHPERSLSHHPLFQVMYNHLRQDLTIFKSLPGLEIRGIEREHAATQFDLTLTSLEDESGKLWSNFNYASDLFDRATIERLAAQWLHLLAEIASNPERAVSDLALSSGADRARALQRCHGRTSPLAAPSWILAQIAERVRLEPSATALVFETESLEFRQLHALASRLAQRLRQLGVGPDELVAVAVERSLKLPVVLLAVLLAGGAYVPLDLQHPRERLEFMLSDARPRVLITEQQVLSALPPTSAAVWCVDRDWPELQALPAVPPEVACSPDQLAYCMYTSGSTGKPKAVAMRSGALAELLRWQEERLPGAWRTAQFASIGFDVSFQEIFGTWVAGGTIVLVPEEARRDLQRLAGLLRDGAVERLYLPFAVLQPLAEIVLETDLRLPALRELITAGEQLKLTPALLGWMNQEPERRLINHYGPTEAHVVTDFIVPATGAEHSLPPIGRPITNTYAYTLDGELQLTPPAVPGELYLGGESLARGYHGRPSLTAERFVPDPFSSTPGARLYRTGDVARWRPDGELEYVGRRDQQVKIRGFRVELGEIEARLAEHPAVRGAALMVREWNGQKQLVAYVVAPASAPARPAELSQALQAHLADTLPEYMVPKHFVQLAELPLNANGKVDRQRLPAPNWQERSYVPPRTSLEQGLAEIWQQVLGVPQVGLDDNFFDLGGHSLLAAQVVSRINKAYALELPLRRVFEASTLAQLAAELEAARPADAAADLAQLDQWLDELGQSE